jgi:hypothetical protein
MKKLIPAMLIVTLVLASMLSFSCAAKETTRTITVTNVVPTLVQGEMILTTLPSTVVSPVFQNPPPDIPHVYVITEMGNPYIGGLIAESGAAICFECHGMPTQHEAWRYDPNICLDCHQISPNPRLNP